MSRPIGTAIGRLLAVFNSADAAEAAQAALAASGILADAIELFAGPDDADLFDSSGKRRGLRGRLYRIVEFSWADQAPDFAWYEAALREGRVVLSVKVRGQVAIRDASAILIEHGGHFMNHFAWFETQELARWRGPEPKLPGYLRR